MVAHEPKASPLREDGRVVVKRPIPKGEDKAARHAITLCSLDQIAVRYGFAFQGAEGQEAMDYAFRMAYRGGARLEEVGREQHKNGCRQDVPPRTTE
jgi:hypothetical protein